MENYIDEELNHSQNIINNENYFDSENLFLLEVRVNKKKFIS